MTPIRSSLHLVVVQRKNMNLIKFVWKAQKKWSMMKEQPLKHGSIRFNYYQFISILSVICLKSILSFSS